MSQNSQFLNEMLNAFWTHLEANADFQALALKEFRLHDGRALPIDDEGLIAENELPAIYVDSFEPTIERTDTTPIRDRVILTLNMGIVYSNSASHEDHPALLALAAQMTVLDAIANQTSYSRRLDNPAAIHDYTWDLKDINPVLMRTGRGVLYWDAGLSVTLIRRRNMPAA